MDTGREQLQQTFDNGIDRRYRHLREQPIRRRRHRGSRP
jgi:hypothetical protein